MRKVNGKVAVKQRSRSVQTRREASAYALITFCDGQTGEPKVLPALVDTGNLCRRDLLDYKEFERMYPDKRNRPKLERCRAVEACGGNEIRTIGQYMGSYKFDGVSSPWNTQVVVVRNLGHPHIISARTIIEMPMVVDLSTASAYVGDYGHRVALYPIGEATELARLRRKEPVAEKDPVIERNTEHYPDEEEAHCVDAIMHKYGRPARLVNSVTIPPHSYVDVQIKAIGQGQLSYFRANSNKLKRKRLSGVDGLLTSSELTGKATVTLLNPTPHERKLNNDSVVGRMIELEREKKSMSKQAGRNCGACKRRKDGKRPDFQGTKLDESNYEEIKKELFKFVGDAEEVPRKREKEMREEINRLFDNRIQTNEHLAPIEKRLLEDLLYRFYKIISKSKFDVGCTDLVEFKVDTGNAEPIKGAVRPLNPPMRTHIRATLKEQEQHGMVRLGHGRWSSPMVPVKKKGKIRWATDYRALNEVTKPDVYPCANTLDNLRTDRLKDANYFIGIDLAGAYLAVRVSDDSREKLAMATTEGLYEVLRMPFGPKNACGCYARLMKLTFGHMIEASEVLNYFDDNLLVCNSFLHGLVLFADFLQCVEVANLRIRPEKTELFVKEVDWLGHHVTSGDLSTQNRLVQQIVDWARPNSAKEMRSFMGLVQYYRGFIKGCSGIAAPLCKLMSDDVPFEWGDEQEGAFKKLKEILSSKPVLVHPDFNSPHPFILDCDASGYGLGGVLSQKQADGAERPIAYDSSVLSKAEKNYSTTRKELLAVVKMAKKFHFFLYGRPFKIRTDHGALPWLMKTKAIDGQLLRWVETLQEIGVTMDNIEYRPGGKHGNADAMSRYPRPENIDDKEQLELTKEDEYWFNELGIKPGPVARRAAAKKKKEEKVGVMTRSKTAKESAKVAEERQDLSDRDSNEPVRSGGPDHDPAENENSDPVPSGDIAHESADDGMEMEEKLDNRSPEAPLSGRTKVGLEETVEGESDSHHNLGPCLCERVPGKERAVREMMVLDQETGKDWTENPRDLEHSSEQRKLLKQQTDMSKEQRKDPKLKEVMKWVKTGRAPKPKELKNPVLQRYASHFDKLEMKDDKLYFTEMREQVKRFRLCIPEEKIADMIRCLHMHPLCGHLGFTRTYLAAKYNFYWPGMGGNIREAINGCPPCKKAKTKQPVKAVPLGQTSTAANERFKIWYADLVGPWPTAGSPTQYKYLLTMMDAVTKWPEAWLLSNITAEKVTDLLLREFIPRYGGGILIKTDRGRQFTSALFKQACQRLKVLTATTQAYSPQTNPVERMHRTLETSIRANMEMEQAAPSQWWRYVGPTLAALRQTPLSSLGNSPHFYVYAAEPVVPAQVFAGEVNSPNVETSLDKGVERLRKVMEATRTRQLESHLKNAEAYNKKVREVPLTTGDWVYKFTPSDVTASGISKKTATFLEGPYRVKDVLNERQIVITKRLEQSGGKTRRVDETVARDRLIKSSTWDLTKLPPPVAFPIAKRYKIPKERMPFISGHSKKSERAFAMPALFMGLGLSPVSVGEAQKRNETPTQQSPRQSPDPFNRTGANSRTGSESDDRGNENQEVLNGSNDNVFVDEEYDNADAGRDDEPLDELNESWLSPIAEEAEEVDEPPLPARGAVKRQRDDSQSPLFPSRGAVKRQRDSPGGSSLSASPGSDGTPPARPKPTKRHQETALGAEEPPPKAKGFAAQLVDKVLAKK